MTPGPARWRDACLALDLGLCAPAALGGIHVVARAGPVRDAFLAHLPPHRRIGPSVSDDTLFGGIDIAATLSAGTPVHSAGLAAAPGPIVLTMAERCDARLAARLAQILDARSGHLMIVLDESADDGEGVPKALLERLAFRADLDGLRLEDIAPSDPVDASVRPAACDPGTVEALTAAAARFGIDSLRAPMMALSAARVHAAIAGRETTCAEDIETACRLVYPQRATMIADDTAQEQPEQEQSSDQSTSEDQATQGDSLPEDMLIDAVRAMLPDGLLAALSAVTNSRGASGSGAGAKQIAHRRGRPLPARQGRPNGQSRIDLIATLRAAAPWQTIRRRAQPDRTGILIRPSDLHVRRYEERSERLIIFAVDASGSSAVARLAEAKGAVEIMLTEAYARRDHVALIAFRGEDADLVLPPTRSLVQTKRRLAGVPGGGGTPLAAGLRAAADLATRSRGQGLSPSLALLTDGRANVPLPGRTGRAAASEDADRMARLWAGLDLPAAVVDTANRPQRDLAALSATLGGTYVPLPRADARGLSRAIGDALGA